MGVLPEAEHIPFMSGTLWHTRSLCLIYTFIKDADRWVVLQYIWNLGPYRYPEVLQIVQASADKIAAAIKASGSNPTEQLNAARGILLEKAGNVKARSFACRPNCRLMT